MEDKVKIYTGHTLECLRQIEPGTVQTCVTSPPYFGLRDYGTEPVHWPQMTYSLFRQEIIVPEQDASLGLENTPQEFIGHLVQIFREVRNTLRDDGTLWVNMGDSYWTGKGLSGSADPTKQAGRYKAKQSINKEYHQTGGKGVMKPQDRRHEYIKAKDLTGIPWMLAFALREDGWYLRQDIIWSKPNPMPESVTDRCTKAHEYLFLLTKRPKYYYDADAIKTPLKDESIMRLAQDIENQKGSDRVPGKTNGTMKAMAKKRKDYDKSMAGGGSNIKGHSGYFNENGELLVGSTANKKSVWHVATRSYTGAHFATYPPELIMPCILAGAPEGGIVLDPFLGSGTTAEVALRAGRKCIGIDLNPANEKLQEQRISHLKNTLF